jgi:hypothetical protein
MVTEEKKTREREERKFNKKIFILFYLPFQKKKSKINRDKIVFMLLIYFIPLHTSQIERNGKLDE